MGKLNFVLTKLIFWPIIALTSVLLSSFEFAPGDFYKGYSDPGFYIMAGVIFFLIIIYFVLEHRLNKFKVHPVYFPICLTLLVLMITTIWMQGSETFTNSETNYTIVVSITVAQKIKFSVVIALFLTNIYMILFSFGRKQFRVKQIFWFVRIYIAFVVFAIIYSISTEFTTLKGIFVSEGTDLVGLSSFFHNENLFAMFILYAIFGCFILNFYHTRPHNYILIAGLFFYMTLTTCAATFFVGLCAVIIYIIFDLIRNFKKHWVLTLISAGISTAIIVGAIIFFSTAYSNEISWVKNLFTYIQKEIFSKDFNTFTGRTRIWKDIFDNLINTNLVNLLIGRGYGTSSMFLKGLGLMHSSGSFERAIISAHNGLINILLNSGLIGLGLYAILILLVVFTCIYLLFRKKVNLSITFGLIICGVLAHSLLESVAFYSTSMVNMLVTIMFMCPLFNCARGVFNPKLVNQVKNGDYAYSKMQYRKLRRFISVVIISLIIPCVTLLTSLMTYQHKEMLNTVLTILVVLAISLIFVPQLITMFYKDSSRKRFIFRTIFYPILTIALVSVLSGLYVQFLYNKINIKPYLATLIIFVSILLVLTFIFTLVKKDRFVHYLSDTFFHSLCLVKIALPIALVVGVLGNVIYDMLFVPTPLTVLEINTIPFILYFVLFATIPSKEKYYYTNYFNELSLYNLKRTTLKYKI